MHIADLQAQLITYSPARTEALQRDLAHATQRITSLEAALDLSVDLDDKDRQLKRKDDELTAKEQLLNDLQQDLNRRAAHLRSEEEAHAHYVRTVVKPIENINEQISVLQDAIKVRASTHTTTRNTYPRLASDSLLYLSFLFFVQPPGISLTSFHQSFFWYWQDLQARLHREQDYSFKLETEIAALRRVSRRETSMRQKLEAAAAYQTAVVSPGKVSKTVLMSPPKVGHRLFVFDFSLPFCSMPVTITFMLVLINEKRVCFLYSRLRTGQRSVACVRHVLPSEVCCYL